MPANISPSPTGSWSGTALAPRRAFIMSTTPRKSAPGGPSCSRRRSGERRTCRPAPDGLRLRLHTADGAEQGNGTVQDAQRALDFDREVDVAWGVDDVHAVVTPEAGGRALVMVMPRSFSCSIQSIVAAPSWTSPMRCSRPV